MAIISFDDVGADLEKKSDVVPSGTGEGRKNKTKTQVWINVGIRRGGELLTLPLGIPFDSLEPRPIPGPKSTNVKFKKMRKAEADMFHQLSKLVSTLTPGQAMNLTELGKFEVEVRRIDAVEAEEEDPTENEFAIGKLF